MKLAKKTMPRSQEHQTWMMKSIIFISLAVFVGVVSTSISMMGFIPESYHQEPCVGNTTIHKNENSLKKNDILPIAPKSSFASLDSFFSNYSGIGGWIDVGALPSSTTSELRQIAKDIMGRNIQCGYPRVNISGTENTTDHIILPDKENTLEYCFWENDIVSSLALNDFNFEKLHWEWVAKSFQRLDISHPGALSASESDCCKRLAFLDIGVNVGDWISPIRLLAPPTVPIYGVEGSPATAAVATANLQTSSLYIVKEDQKSCSKLLPFTLVSKSKIPTIHHEGGVCFSKPAFIGGNFNKFNVGGRHIIDQQMNQCQKASDVAGATTLEHAIESLCQSNTVPKVYILKIDVEGFEFKAISSVISSWLTKTPPCYFVMEFWNKPSYLAVVETLLTVVGYDAVWRPMNQEYPHNTQPWLKGLTGTQDEVGKIAKVTRSYTELIFGFTDVDKCINNLMNTN